MHEPKDIVINTGPLLALIASFNDLTILNKLYKRVFVSREVILEIEAGGSSGFGVDVFNKSNFLDKSTALLSISPFLQNALDLGEASVIQLALNNNIQTVCIDEAMGRRVARLNNLQLTGSIGMLIHAKHIGFNFSMTEAIENMKSHGIYLSRNLIEYALKQVNEI